MITHIVASVVTTQNQIKKKQMEQNNQQIKEKVTEATSKSDKSGTTNIEEHRKEQ